MWTPCVKTSVWTPQADPPIWKFCELYDPSQGTIGILHNLCKTAKSVWLPQQMANRLFRLFCWAFFFSFFFFVLFCSQSNTFLHQIIFPLKLCGQEGLATVIQSLQVVKPGTSSLNSPVCYNPSGAVEMDCHHGHKLSTLRLERPQREAALCCCATGSYQIIFLINLSWTEKMQHR